MGAKKNNMPHNMPHNAQPEPRQGGRQGGQDDRPNIRPDNRAGIRRGTWRSAYRIDRHADGFRREMFPQESAAQRIIRVVNHAAAQGQPSTPIDDAARALEMAQTENRATFIINWRDVNYVIDVARIALDMTEFQINQQQAIILQAARYHADGIVF